MSDQTPKTFDQVRRELISEFNDADQEAYAFLVDWLRKTDVAANALRVGDTAPDFLLPDENGRLHSSKELRREQPLVVSFYRGGWCPFCKAELRALQAIKPDLDRLKAKIVVVSPDTRDLPRQLKEELGLDLTMLADVDHGVATAYGILYRVPEETRAHYSGLGHDFGHRHGSTEWMLPIPATYVIDKDGVVRAAFVEPDFTIRQETSDILDEISQLARPEKASTSDE